MRISWKLLPPPIDRSERKIDRESDKEDIHLGEEKITTFQSIDLKYLYLLKMML